VEQITIRVVIIFKSGFNTLLIVQIWFQGAMQYFRLSPSFLFRSRSPT